MQFFERTTEQIADSIVVHDLGQHDERLLFRHVQQQGRTNKGQPLTVTDFFVENGIGLAQLVQIILSHGSGVAKIFIGRKSTIDVSADVLFKGRLFVDQNAIRLDQSLVIVAHDQQLPDFSSKCFRNAVFD